MVAETAAGAAGRDRVLSPRALVGRGWRGFGRRSFSLDCSIDPLPDDLAADSAMMNGSPRMGHSEGPARAPTTVPCEFTAVGSAPRQLAPPLGYREVAHSVHSERGLEPRRNAAKERGLTIRSGGRMQTRLLAPVLAAVLALTGQTANGVSSGSVNVLDFSVVVRDLNPDDGSISVSGTFQGWRRAEFRRRGGRRHGEHSSPGHRGNGGRPPHFVRRLRHAV